LLSENSCCWDCDRGQRKGYGLVVGCCLYQSFLFLFFCCLVLFLSFTVVPFLFF
jgi:hypothetical protein